MVDRRSLSRATLGAAGRMLMAAGVHARGRYPPGWLGDPHAAMEEDRPLALYATSDEHAPQHAPQHAPPQRSVPIVDFPASPAISRHLPPSPAISRHLPMCMQVPIVDFPGLNVPPPADARTPTS